MGFFSWDCRGCQHPLLSSYSTNHINRWMQDAVVIRRNGVLMRGHYDGYGRVDGKSIPVLNPEVWHAACHRAAGSPVRFTAPSKHSEDQGFFFREGTHDLQEPKAPMTSSRRTARARPRCPRCGGKPHRCKTRPFTDGMRCWHCDECEHCWQAPWDRPKEKLSECAR